MTMPCLCKKKQNKTCSAKQKYSAAHTLVLFFACEEVEKCYSVEKTFSAWLQSGASKSEKNVNRWNETRGIMRTLGTKRCLDGYN